MTKQEKDYEDFSNAISEFAYQHNPFKHDVFVYATQGIISIDCNPPKIEEPNPNQERLFEDVEHD